MFLCNRYAFRRRHAIRLFLFFLAIYFCYLSLAALGKLGGLDSSHLAASDTNNNNKDDATIGLSFRDANKKSYLKYDNMNRYALLSANGAMGKGMTIDEKTLGGDEKQQFDDGWNKYAFNHYASTLIPENRTLPDVRLAGCKSERYDDELPAASIIMCFHNEAWTVLIRGVLSIVNRTPSHLLQEILLVDDFSDFEHLLEPLDTYLYENFGDKVRVVRNKKREGLIRSRLHGAGEAKGQVLIFLDSHIEATVGWIEPLLHSIKQNKTNVITPMIDIIDKQTFEYKYNINNRVSVGGFDWNMQVNTKKDN